MLPSEAAADPLIAELRGNHLYCVDWYRMPFYPGAFELAPYNMSEGDPRYQGFFKRYGGIVGGITNGNEIVVRAAIKPTASISSPQMTLSTETGRPEKLIVKGRHDACIAMRAPVVVEAAVAIALCDLSLIAKAQGL